MELTALVNACMLTLNVFKTHMNGSVNHQPWVVVISKSAGAECPDCGWLPEMTTPCFIC